MQSNKPPDSFPWSTNEAIATLSKGKFGRALAGAVEATLARGRAAIFHRHRDYCGHGLVYEKGRYLLVNIEDGGYAVNLPPVASWSTKEEFISFWEEQSDFGCSGAHSSAVPFYTRDRWARNNQRLTREKLEAFAAGRSWVPGESPCARENISD
jgi:hypothetical protein